MAGVLKDGYDGEGAGFAKSVADDALTLGGRLVRRLGLLGVRRVQTVEVRHSRPTPKQILKLGKYIVVVLAAVAQPSKILHGETRIIT
ncbi:MAG: hypothetical protein P8X74_14500 [Reinekea sp.]